MMFASHIKVAASLMAVVVVSACSVHPLPEDVSRKSTYDIVKKLRCEAREGVLHASLPEPALANTYIGFDFEFDMTENNAAASGLLEFVNPYAGGKFSLDVKGGADKSRQTVRFFRVVERLKDLRDDVKCVDPAEQANLVYPISGSVGLDEVVDTYWKLQTLTTFVKRNKQVFSDTLTFTTTLSAGVTPTLEIGNSMGGFKLTKASISGSVKRIDKHNVTVAISEKSDVSDLATTYNELYIARRGGPSLGVGSAASGVILELDRLRNRSEDQKILENLQLQ